MARVFYLGAPWQVPQALRAGASEALAATGNNTGNLLIGAAIMKHLKVERLGHGLSVNRRAIREEFDYIIVGASNFLYRGFDFGEYADFLEDVQLPCYIIGLGAQAPGYEDRVEIPRGTLRLMSIISERSKWLGVRGYFTASTLIDAGIRNVKVIGCPSMYWNCKPDLAITRPVYSPKIRVSINGTIHALEHSLDPDAAANLEKRLARFAYQNNCPYILQTERPLMEIYQGSGELRASKGLIRSLQSRYGLENLSEEEFIRFVRRNMRVFFDTEQWIEEMKHYDLIIGTRFHGCLAGILAGKPAFIYVHDARTREMCELLNVPHSDVRSAGEIDPEEICSAMDIAALRTAYKYLFWHYVDFLDGNGIEHILPQD